ncbi:Uma2 family endonuclease [Gordonia sp. CPCC 205515]|uniref:Uma2 family endonuclease n=1 Tax=Gordonia sp. CPCC 205515 TaxID=3140791 RepID=UPI003AF33264
MGLAIERHSGPWTPSDVEKLAESGDHSRYELLTPGVLTVSPAPGTVHQRASRRLANLLEAAATDAGQDVEVLEAVNIETADGRLAVPDVAIVRGEVADRNPVRYPTGSVLLVAEIVSPGSEPQDRFIKPRLYAAAGVSAYWRFELDGAPRIVVHTLDADGQFAATATLLAGTVTTVDAPFPINVDPGLLVIR